MNCEVWLELQCKVEVCPRKGICHCVFFTTDMQNPKVVFLVVYEVHHLMDEDIISREGVE